jgi:hypothetical protein
MDDFGRVTGSSGLAIPPLSPRRSPFDCEPDVTFAERLSAPERTIAQEISQVVVHICSPHSRPTNTEIRQMANYLFRSYCKSSELVVDVILEAICRMSGQVEALSCLLACFSLQFGGDLVDRMIETTVPQILSHAFGNDQFRTIKLLLRFLGSFVYFNIITLDSFASLLVNLSKQLPNATLCRGQALARALCIGMNTPSLDLPSEARSEVTRQLHDFVIRDDYYEFVRRLSPFHDRRDCYVSLLATTSLCGTLIIGYYPDCAGETAGVAIPHVQFEFGPIDRAPFPFTLIPNSICPEKISPYFADIADDILVYFGSDVRLVADQFFGFSMLVSRPSLKRAQSFVIPLFLTVILSDLLRIPDSYYPPVFHATLVSCLIAAGARREEEIRSHLSHLIIEVVHMIETRDAIRYIRLVKFLSHTISLCSFAWCWSDWNLADDTERLFVREVIQECFSMGNAETVQGLDIDGVIPPRREIRYDYGPGREYSIYAEEVIRGMVEDPANVEQMVAELRAKLGNAVAMRLVLSLIFYEGHGETEATIREIGRFSRIIRTNVVDEADCGTDMLVTVASHCFEYLPHVSATVITYFIFNGYISQESFLEYFFDWRKESPVAGKRESWTLFHGVMNSILTCHLRNGEIEEAKEVIREVLRAAGDFSRKVARPWTGRELFLDHFSQFAWDHYEVFLATNEEMKELIARRIGLETVLETFIDLIPE